MAVLALDLDELASFVRSGLDVTARDADGRSALHHSAISKAYDCAVMLVGVPGIVGLRDNGGWTALHFSAQEQDVRLAELLVARGAEIDAEDSHGNTPLARAVFTSAGKCDMIKFLTAHGADRNHKNEHGVSPLDLASRIANYNMRACFVP
jgi:ankyrin repeat protein